MGVKGDDVLQRFQAREVWAWNGGRGYLVSPCEKLRASLGDGVLAHPPNTNFRSIKLKVENIQLRRINKDVYKT